MAKAINMKKPTINDLIAAIITIMVGTVAIGMNLRIGIILIIFGSIAILAILICGVIMEIKERGHNDKR